jgi:hypothetical protein
MRLSPLGLIRRSCLLRRDETIESIPPRKLAAKLKSLGLASALVVEFPGRAEVAIGSAG